MRRRAVTLLSRPDKTPRGRMAARSRARRKFFALGQRYGVIAVTIASVDAALLAPFTGLTVVLTCHYPKNPFYRMHLGVAAVAKAGTEPIAGWAVQPRA